MKIDMYKIVSKKLDVINHVFILREYVDGRRSNSTAFECRVSWHDAICLTGLAGMFPCNSIDP